MGPPCVRGVACPAQALGRAATAEAVVVVDAGDDDAAAPTVGVNDLVVADVHGNVVGGRSSVVGVEDEVAGLELGDAGDPAPAVLHVLELAVAVVAGGGGDGVARLGPRPVGEAVAVPVGAVVVVAIGLAELSLRPVDGGLTGGAPAVVGLAASAPVVGAGVASAPVVGAAAVGAGVGVRLGVRVVPIVVRCGRGLVGGVVVGVGCPQPCK